MTPHVWAEGRPGPLDPVTLTLTDAEADEMRRECARRAGAVLELPLDSQELLATVELAGARLPERLLRELSRFRAHGNEQGGLVIRNVPVDRRLPPTPAGGYAPEWQTLPVSTFAQLAISSRLGDVIAYADEKAGRLVQDIVPVRGAETRQENTGTVYLELHTEDGFHPHKPDFVTLLCLRPDHDRVACTLLGALGGTLSCLSESCLQALREPLFRIRISSSFGEQGSAGWSPWMPVVSPDGTEFVLDMHAMDPRDARARQALAELEAVLVPALSGAVLDTGDLLVIDNRAAVHGRTAFAARYDGTDRWLRRSFAVSDLRRSSAVRTAGSRICRPLTEFGHGFEWLSTPRTDV